MPVQQNTNNTPTDPDKSIKIFQINLNKSEKAHLELINDEVSRKYDIMLIQEPYTTTFNGIRTPANFRPVFPANRLRDDTQIRSVIWVNKKLNTNDWTILEIPGTNDITAIQLTGNYGKVSLFNVYNDCTHSRNEVSLRNYIRDNTDEILRTENHHMIWAGDFNRHHPLWDDDADTHLFTSQATRMAEGLISLMADYEMSMALPKGIPTLEHMRTKKYSRPDNVFNTPGLTEHIVKCEVVPESRPTSTDHFPILTTVILPQEKNNSPPSYNFRLTDWDVYKKKLSAKLRHTSDTPVITNIEQLNTAATDLITAIQETTQETVKRSEPRPDAKRWWNSDLNKMKQELNRLRAESYKHRAMADHTTHRTFRKKSNEFGEAIIKAKRTHWTDYLEEMTANEIWTANKYLKEPAGDGGCPRIPTLRTRNERDEATTINSNEDKAKVFASVFFPLPPQTANEHNIQEYPEPLPDPPQLSTETLERHVAKLSPYKAHGPDEIPNIIIKQCLPLIKERLIRIYRAILELGIYLDQWREFTTVVLRKPNKPSYETPKAYRPIALLPTLAKVLTSIVAEYVGRLVEKHQLLPNTHFGGRPGRTTTDAVHYLVHKIKESWREDQVVSVLFLDVEGAFPNAVTAKLIHNLKKRRIPKAIVNFVSLLLDNRRTKIRFDDYTSGSLEITNGIGQGDPLSMILYILYNADLLEIAGDENKEDAIGYVDDVALIAIGEDFNETTQRLKDMMTKEEGGLKWSREHNSRFEVTKSAVVHFTRKKGPDPDSARGRIPLEKPALIIDGQTVKEVEFYKYLGIHLDAQLRWREQAQRVVANATKWLLQFRRLTRPSTGVNSRLMRQLYLSVALPKITYGLDVWYTPPTKPAGHTKNTGSVGILKCLQKTQRIASLAITGSLRTTPTDLLDTHAGIFPMELALLKACHRAIIRTLTLPDTHPLHRIVTQAKRTPPTRHLSPIDQLIKNFKLKNIKVETISPIQQNDTTEARCRTMIAKSREVSILYESRDKADFKIFSDGSGQDEGIGAAAIMFRKDRATPVKSLKSYLGSSKKHNTFEAEAVGAILATWIIKTTPDTIGKKVTMYIDNQAIIMSLKGRKSTSGQYLIDQLKKAINDLQCNLTISWISSHSEVKGNEDADRLAKEAAAGRASGAAHLPHALRSPLPMSASAIKQEYHARLNRSWLTFWSRSPRYDRFSQVDEDFPFNSYRKKIYKLSRNQASILMQIRTGHVPLNSYLKRIGKLDDNNCKECNTDQQEDTIVETVNHFIFACPAHERHRRELSAKISGNQLSLSELMSNVDNMKALTTYINKTGRFKEKT